MVCLREKLGRPLISTLAATKGDLSMRRKRYLAKQVVGGDVNLPRSLSFLSEAKYHSVVEESTEGRRKWLVEMTPRHLRELLEAEARSEFSDKERDEYKNVIRDQKTHIARLEEQVRNMEHEKEVLVRQHNEFAKQVVQEDGRIRIPRSEKNYLAVAEERGTKFGSPPIQGGLAGLEKK